MIKMPLRKNRNIDEVADKMNDMMNLRRRGDHIGDEEEDFPFMSLRRKNDLLGKGGFGREEDIIEDVVVVANDLCSSMI
ncbi:hypothetical protein Tco_1420182 [Tanacetum coccineum]